MRCYRFAYRRAQPPKAEAKPLTALRQVTISDGKSVSATKAKVGDVEPVPYRADSNSPYSKAAKVRK